MSRHRLTFLRLAALAPVLCAAALADGPPPKNQLTGVVTYKRDGRPAAGVPIVMSHAQKGYIYMMENGLGGYGEDERVLNFFIKRNSRYTCTTITDEAGRFTLTNFADPDQPWNIAAGEAASGYVLRTDLHPADYAATPLKLEIDEPAYITTAMPKLPRTYRGYLGVSLAPVRPPDTAETTVEEDQDELAIRVYIRGDWSDSQQKKIRVGPLPGGHRYRLTVSGHSGNLPYSPTFFVREVAVAPGATETVALESKEGTTLSGRVTATDGKPLNNVNLTVRTADGLILGAMTRKDGNYELTGVPAGTHTLKLLRHAKRTLPG